MKNSWIKHDRVTSTNTCLSDLVKQQSMEEGTIVIADYQDGGRGLGEHSWLSRRGENLLMSLLLIPAFLSASKQFHLSRVASLALCDVLETLGIDPVIKWPNDILTRKGKIAGILIEHGITAGSISHTVIGIGLNLNQTLFPAFQVPATSVRLETGQGVNVDEVGEMVEASLMSRYHGLKEGLTQLLEKEYLERLFMAGVPSVFKAGGEVFEGTIRGVTDFGELMVECEGEIRTFGHGAISMELKSGNP
ncbi:MAG: biotin--[acetyl-CoA-carboxylase] ligase [Bacteroidales bacterium]|nr:biotin--[acetyl-CoA-carboxylase] ligase [Bacteroidales bacterium]